MGGGSMRLRLALLVMAGLAMMHPGRAWAAGPTVCTLIADAKSGTLLLREGECTRRHAPMSSFKLPLALMGFDSGILTSATSPKWPVDTRFPLSARERRIGSADPGLWEAESLLWFSRRLVAELGEARFGRYVRMMRYGNGDISGDPGKANGLTHSWLKSSLRISPEEQVDFLLRFRRQQLGLKPEAYTLTAAIIPRFSAGNWEVQGKTGSTGPGKDALGWFIGWAEQGGREIVFVRLLAGPIPQGTMGGPMVRDTFLADLPTLLPAR